MAKQLTPKPILSKYSFVSVVKYKSIIIEKSVELKIVRFKRCGVEISDLLKAHINIYYSYLNLKTADFFSVNNHAAIGYVNDYLVSQNMITLDEDEAYNLLESDDEFSDLFSNYLGSKVADEINRVLESKIADLIEGHAFCDPDFDDDFDSYKRRYDIINQWFRNYFYLKDVDENSTSQM